MPSAQSVCKSPVFLSFTLCPQLQNSGFLLNHLTSSFVVMRNGGWGRRGDLTTANRVGWASERLPFPQPVIVPKMDVMVPAPSPSPHMLSARDMHPSLQRELYFHSFADGCLEHLFFSLAPYLTAVCGWPKLHGEATWSECTEQWTAWVDFQTPELASFDVLPAQLSDDPRWSSSSLLVCFWASKF